MIFTVVDALFVLPALVVQLKTNWVFCVKTGVFATPEGLAFPAFSCVKPVSDPLEITQLSIPPVTHPMFDVSPDLISFGFATSTIDGLFTCTVHCAESTTPSFEHVRPKVCVFDPRVGDSTLVVAFPKRAPFVANPLPELAAEF